MLAQSNRLLLFFQLIPVAAIDIYLPVSTTYVSALGAFEEPTQLVDYLTAIRTGSCSRFTGQAVPWTGAPA